MPQSSGLLCALEHRGGKWMGAHAGARVCPDHMVALALDSVLLRKVICMSSQ